MVFEALCQLQDIRRMLLMAVKHGQDMLALVLEGSARLLPAAHLWENANRRGRKAAV